MFFSYYGTSAVRATAWLTVYWMVSNLQYSIFIQKPITKVYEHLDFCKPTVFDNDIDTGVSV